LVAGLRLCGAKGPEVSVFTAIHRVTLKEDGERTKLTLLIRLTAASPGAAPAIAGIQIGWKQLLTKLARRLTADTGNAPVGGVRADG
jgi:hypothetical protein